MARRVSNEYLSADARIRLPTPDEALNIAYALHAASDTDLCDTPIQALAKEIADRFKEMKPRRNNHAEEAYLEDALKPNVHSYARAISQRKRRYNRRLEQARTIREDKISILNGGQFSKQWVGVLWRLVQQILLPSVFAIFGYLLAKLIGTSDLIPDNVASTTGPGLPSIALSVFFGWLGRVVSVQLYNRARDLINKEYEERIKDADYAYDVGKVEEFKLAHAKLCEAWRQYTGRSYTKSVNYQAVMEGDIALKKRFNEYIEKHNQGIQERVGGFFKDVGTAAKKLRRKESSAQLPAANQS